MTRELARRSVFLDHTDLEIFDVYDTRRGFHDVAHRIVISGVSYISQFYFALDRPFDVIEEVLAYGHDYRKASNLDDYAAAKHVKCSLIQREITKRFICRSFRGVMRVQLQSISSMPYYGIFDLHTHVVFVARRDIIFYMALSGPLHTNTQYIDPLIYELRYVRNRDRRRLNSYIVEYTSQQLWIPMNQLRQCVTVKSAQALDNVIHTCIHTSDENRKKLREIFAPKTAQELYDEVINTICEALKKHIIPPIADIVRRYVL